MRSHVLGEAGGYQNKGILIFTVPFLSGAGLSPGAGGEGAGCGQRPGVGHSWAALRREVGSRPRLSELQPAAAVRQGSEAEPQLWAYLHAGGDKIN